jgi:hypothetical protein
MNVGSRHRSLPPLVALLAASLAACQDAAPPSPAPGLTTDAIPMPPSPAPEPHSRARPWWYDDQPVPPGLVQLGLGVEHACGLLEGGHIQCWGQQAHGRSDPPRGAFESLAVGGEHACALDAGGQARCWGRDADGSTAPPPEHFTQLSAGFAHTCGLRRDASVACWGWDGEGQASPPPGSFIAVFAGYHHSCALDAQGDAHCWGRDPGAPPAPGPFVALALGEGHACGLGADGSVACWGNETQPQGQPATLDAAGVPRAPPHQGGWTSGLLTAPPGRYLDLAVGGQHSCALHEAGGVVCWGHDAAFQSRPPQLPFRSIAAGYYHGCGITEQGQPTCWGWRGQADREGQPTPEWRDDGTLVDPRAELPITCPYEGLGMLYLSQGRREDARAMLTTATELVPHLEHGKYNGLARIHMEEGDLSAARTMLERSVAITPAPSNEAWRLLEQLDSAGAP